MSNKIKDLIKKSGKNSSITFEGKERRTALNNDFGKSKMDIAIEFIGGPENSKVLSKLLK